VGPPVVFAIGVGAFALGTAVGAIYPRPAFKPSEEVRPYWSRITLEMVAFGVVASACLLAGAVYGFNRETVNFFHGPESGRVMGFSFALIGIGGAGFAGLLLASWVRGRER
jgi:hypothetical protein